MRVAVATKTGLNIDEHFGQTERLDIYDVSAGQVALVERRMVDSHCRGGAVDDDRRETLLRAIADCAAVFAARVGEGPRQIGRAHV